MRYFLFDCTIHNITIGAVTDDSNNDMVVPLTIMGVLIVILVVGLFISVAVNIWQFRRKRYSNYIASCRK